jgi:uncharacterized membrane-anchored protein
VTLYAGPRPRGARLDGPERALDGFIGLIVLVVEVLVGALVLLALDDYVQQCLGTGCQSRDALEFGFLLALIGSGLAFLITTIAYLVRLARARRSWPAPLWGLILVSASCIVGWLIMSGG